MPVSLRVLFWVTLATALSPRAFADAWACARADQLTASWTQADTVEKRLTAMKESYDFLKSRVKLARDDDEVAAVTRLFGGIYARDYDPKSDLLSLYRVRLRDPNFRRVFDAEVARMPGPVRDKLEQGVLNLKTRQ